MRLYFLLAADRILDFQTIKIQTNKNKILDFQTIKKKNLDFQTTKEKFGFSNNKNKILSPF